ncbi:hypothetical protein TRFO_15156 [Tritrichomonas foetus]|uniref:Repressor of RNA polymerase III transcription n=1 Tax=Tritrichomonas foetus TaxID=1144522 RepID=A0A1J4KY65_9EUKA|nr:hypothetical protein TRFO_15156 [Tritrichomonas foetus]|eukprot:OHT14493.1 hypothetical protein TRFO_15156 [Tritrichomonas foetus]
MTFITNQAIFKVNQELLSLSASTPKVHGKIECFNISKSQRSLSGGTPSVPHFSSSYHPMAVFSSSPVQPAFSSAFSQSTCLHATPQHYAMLIAAFSSAFPDFDFSAVAPWNFKLVPSPEQAQNNINWTFKTALSESDRLMGHIWSVLEKEISPASCYIYMYDSDRPDAFTEMGAVFNLNYFFLNEKMNKIILIHLREGANEVESGSDEEGDSFDEDINYGFI